MKKTVLIILMSFVFASIANAQSYDPNQIYLLENQFTGQLAGQYDVQPPQLGPRILTNDREITILSKVENGRRYYSFSSPYGMQTNDPSHYQRFAARGDGEQLGVAQQGAIWWEILPYVSPEGKRYGYVLIRNKQTGLYMMDTANALNSLSLRDPDRTSGSGAYLAAGRLDPRKIRRYLWYITPLTKRPPDLNLALPQSGWTPHAAKSAVLSSKQPLNQPECRVTDASGKTLFRTSALSWGTFWDGLHYYVCSLNHPALTHTGDYTLEAAGIQKTIRIRDDVFLHPLRQHGTDSFSIQELFDPNLGAVTQWGRLVNWWPSPYRFLDSLSYWDPWDKTTPNTFPDWIWRDDSDSNDNNVTFEPYGGTASYDEADHCLDGSWEMTDQYAHNYPADGIVLFELAQMYRYASGHDLKQRIYDEILYGVRGMLARQESDGSWRQGYMDQIHWTGTSAILGASLAAVYPIVQKRDAALAQRIDQAATKAWTFVRTHESDRTTWPIQGEGKLPNGTTVAGNLPGQRHVWRESYLLFAVTFYHLHPNAALKKRIEEEIARGTIAYNGWVRQDGGKFPGQFTSKWEWAATALIDFYPDASAATQTEILRILDYLYLHTLTDPKNVGGPYGAYGRFLASYGSAYAWEVWKLTMIATRLYDRWGQKYGQGVLLAQKALDWYWGANPYSSSLIFGVGDTYVNGGWSSYHTLGRHTSLEADTMHLLGTDGTYASSETTVLGVLGVWNSVLLLHKHRASLKGVTLYGQSGFRGTELLLPAGRYNRDLLKALGVGADQIRSLKIPDDFSVTLYTGDQWNGTARTLESDTDALGSAETVGSLVVHYTGSLGAPQTTTPDETPDENTDVTEPDRPTDPVPTSPSPQTHTPDPSPHPAVPTSKPDESSETESNNLFVSFLPFGLPWLMIGMFLVASMGARRIAKSQGTNAA